MDIGRIARSVQKRSRRRYQKFVYERADRIAAADHAKFAVFDYPIEPRGRWGRAWNLPDNPALSELIAAGDDRYRAACGEILEFKDALAHISVTRPTDAEQPWWTSGWIPGFDGARLYSLVAKRDPALYLEVGSGNSTKFVRRAIRDHGLRTRIVSIDPRPRAEVDRICDEVIRSPLEDADLNIFSRLCSDDVCFVDGSHRALQNSDVTVLFFEVMPHLASGINLGFHDILLPQDYGPGLRDLWYSEQYVLGAYLLGGAAGATIEFAARYVADHPDLATIIDPVWAAISGGEAIPTTGSSFWLRTA